MNITGIDIEIDIGNDTEVNIGNDTEVSIEIDVENNMEIRIEIETDERYTNRANTVCAGLSELISKAVSKAISHAMPTLAPIHATYPVDESATDAQFGVRGYEVFVLLTGDKEIQYENSRMRGVDSPTDVLSFPMLDAGSSPDINPETGKTILGDIVISLERAKSQAERLGHSFERETAFLAIHGALHLCGYSHNDKAGEENMCAIQRKVLTEMGF